MNGFDDGGAILGADFGSEGTTAPKGLNGRKPVGKNSPATFGLLGEALSDFDAESEAGDIKKVAIIDLPNIDAIDVPCGDDCAGGWNMRGNVERTGEVVGRAEGKNSEGKLGINQSGDRGIQSAIPAADNHQIDPIVVLSNDFRQLVRMRGRLFNQVKPKASELLNSDRNILLPAPRLTVNE